MPITSPYSPVDVRPQLSAEEFYAEYVNKKPVLMPGALAELPAAQRWSLPYLASIAPDLPVRLKTGRVAEGKTTTVRLDDYSKTVIAWEQRGSDDVERPAYLHDVPLLTFIPELRQDLEPFPGHLFPAFFRDNWAVFPQFFVGPSQAVTTLHFDTLLTHNLFFQLDGSKRFVMVANEDRDRCYTYNWRWAEVNPEDPDYDRHPDFRGVRVMEAHVQAGDLFYMPPGTLHQVSSLSSSVSFNIDWHDKVSALRGIAAVRHGMPRQNLRYNLLLALGVYGRVPLKVLMPALRSYFTYIS
ncbi:cupin-like domain-containing protein [Nonomuraea sp. NPDC050547]|uniref:cupin-like domain-containing protein n=1 Tax=unclassified Nonomuraea TaxID=2593643 RepID=UPI00378EDAB4